MLKSTLNPKQEKKPYFAICSLLIYYKVGANKKSRSVKKGKQLNDSYEVHTGSTENNAKKQKFEELIKKSQERYPRKSR